VLKPRSSPDSQKAHGGAGEELEAARAEIANLSKRLAAESRERRKLELALRSLPNEILVAQETERRRIAAELHDGVNQILASIKFRLAHLESKLSGDAADFAREGRQLLDRAVNEVRRISKNLRPSELDDFGLVAAMETLIQEFERRTNLTVSFKRGPLPKRLPAQVELAIYRILQEALANVEQHARARRVQVSFNVDAKFATLNVIDDGAGFVSAGENRSGASGHGLGIVNMRERAQASGGVFAIKSTPGAGTEIAALVKMENGK
jgi:two-component system NarL family sensor kinase